MEAKDNSFLILSVFKRKGGEGDNTKIITEKNISLYINLYKNILEEYENGLIIYFQSNEKWVLYTNKRIIRWDNDSYKSLFYSEMSPLNLQLGVLAKIQYSKSLPVIQYNLKDVKGNSYNLKIEGGEPFKGIFQIISLFC